MIELYTAPTPNGRKISIMLEELGVPYKVHGFVLSERRQKEPDFRTISPNGKIPAIVDRDTGMAMMESGAIMMYLSEKYGKFMPEGEERWRCIEWVMWQMGGLGPICGQGHQFLTYNAGKAPYASIRFRQEIDRLYGVLNERLAGREFIVGRDAGEFSIADMICWPWVARYERHKTDLHAFPNVLDWYLRLAERPAVQRGYHVPRRLEDVPIP